MNCSEARKLSIVDFLGKNNIHPVKEYHHEFLYHCPYRKDSTPSFSVNIEKNVWRDSGRNQGGDLLVLVRTMFNVDIPGALKILAGNKPQSFSFSVQQSYQNSTIDIRHIQPLQNKALIQYLDKRNIPLKIATRYLQEAYYMVNKNQYFALAFKNDKGGFELRSKYFKGCTSPKFYRTIPGNRKHLNIFEGFMDFLSALVYYKSIAPANTTIILNSLSFVNQTLKIIEKYEAVNLYLDNDDASAKAVNEYKKNHSSVNDLAKEIYTNYKDFNDLIIKRH
jgi:Toprim-like/CHC2 zinc finger